MIHNRVMEINYSSIWKRKLSMLILSFVILSIVKSVRAFFLDPIFLIKEEKRKGKEKKVMIFESKTWRN